MAKFVKGQVANPNGRPKGSKDEKWKNIEAIWQLLMNEWEQLSPNQRAGYAMDVFKLHFERAIAQLPKDQNESVIRANEMLEVLKDLETKHGRKPSDTPSMDGRKTPL